MLRAAALLPLTFVLNFSSTARVATAHPFAVSSARAWVHDDRVDVSVDLDGATLSQLYASRFAWDADGTVSPSELQKAKALLDDYLISSTRLLNDGSACRAVRAPIWSTTDGKRVQAHVEVACPLPWGAVTWSQSTLMEDEGGHRIVSEIRTLGHVDRHLFTPEEPVFTVDAVGTSEYVDPQGAEWFGSSDERPTPRASGAAGQPAAPEAPAFTTLLGEGVKHVLLGFDHVLFLIALLLVVPSTRELLMIVTAFTLAHSVTLALGAFDIVSIAPRFVESLIALSIVYIGVENLLRKRPPQRHALAFAFGLVHGFGFASVFRELGLSSDDALLSVISFNLGVEIGQLSLVAPLFVLLRALSGHERPLAGVKWVTSSAIALAGALWFLQRAFDLPSIVAG